MEEQQNSLSPQESLDDFLRAIDAELMARRAEGSSAPDIDAQLARHFEMVTGDVLPEIVAARDRIDDIAAQLSARFDPSVASSRLPGGGLFHRVIGRLTRRHVSPAFEAIEACRRAIEETVAALLVISRLEPIGSDQRDQTASSGNSAAIEALRSEIQALNARMSEVEASGQL